MIGQHLGEQGDVLRLVTKVAKDLLALQVEVEEWTSVDVLGGQPNRNRLAITSRESTQARSVGLMPTASKATSIMRP